MILLLMLKDLARNGVNCTESDDDVEVWTGGGGISGLKGSPSSKACPVG